MRFVFFLFVLFGYSALRSQGIPKAGTDSSVDIANWNIEWFGHAFNGPTDEALQRQNATNIIKATDMDIWGLGEISDPAAWDTLLVRLPEYGGVISTWAQTQKTAVLYKKSIFRLLYSKHILAVYEQEFASGRLPLEVGLELNMGSWKDTLVIFVIHLKANIGTTQEKEDAWQRRKTSSEALKAYVDAMGKWRKSIILGDWNDDIDSSILTNYATPFSQLVSDTTKYFYTTAVLTAAGEKSTVSYAEMIDHQCVTKRLRKDHIPASTSVLYMENYVANYASTTSDHYPVYSRYRFTKPLLSVNHAELDVPCVYYNGEQFVFRGITPAPDHEVLDVMGRKVGQPVPGQVLMVRYTIGKKVFVERMVAPVK